MLKNVLIVMLLIAICIGVIVMITLPRTDIQTISAQAFSEHAKNSTYTIIDIRTNEEYQQGHVLNAQNIDFYKTDTFTSKLDALDKSQKYLIYCRSGSRSAKALAQMNNMGFTGVSDLQGGIIAWQQAGLPLVK